jgi:hypothetical protein
MLFHLRILLIKRLKSNAIKLNSMQEGREKLLGPYVVFPPLLH